jgi:uncharacterized protein
MASMRKNGSDVSSVEHSNERFACACCGSRLELRRNGVLEIESDARISPEAGTMFIDPHAHMISRITDDYEAMARAGIVAVLIRCVARLRRSRSWRFA